MYAKWGLVKIHIRFDRQSSSFTVTKLLETQEDEDVVMNDETEADNSPQKAKPSSAKQAFTY